MPPDDSEESAEQIHRDRREHGGMPAHPDDDQLARLTEEERAAMGLEPYDPDEVPPTARAGRAATPPVTATEQYAEERAEILREENKDELLHKGEHRPYPPTRYE